MISLLVGVAALIPLSFHIKYSEEHPVYTGPRCPYCEKPLPVGDEARELHRMHHALERIETVLTDLVERIRT
jgi:transcription initiation factor IIE alpha subunit